MANSLERMTPLALLVIAPGALAGGYSMASLRLFGGSYRAPIRGLTNARAKSSCSGSTRAAVSGVLEGGAAGARLKPLSFATKLFSASGLCLSTYQIGRAH